MVWCPRARSQRRSAASPGRDPLDAVTGCGSLAGRAAPWGPVGLWRAAPSAGHGLVGSAMGHPGSCSGPGSGTPQRTPLGRTSKGHRLRLLDGTCSQLPTVPHAPEEAHAQLCPAVDRP